MISEHSVELARSHITNYYDSDFFVKPFEFDALWHNWDEVKFYLTETNIKDFKIKQPIYYPAPKSNHGFRIVHQLDPIDSLIYTALAFEIAEKIERKRAPSSEKIVCSYRININNKGNFFSEGNGYQDFLEKSRQFATEKSYVLLTDITDFYNQIYLHRVQNAIEACDHELEYISKDIESFLMSLTTKTSRGIPVGPAASIIMAEAVLMDVDEFILSKDLSYTRYVDDFRIFSSSKEKLNMLLHDLTKYLYDNHRLSLSSLKTKIVDVDEFINNYLENHDELEKSTIHKSLEELNLKNWSDYPFIEQIDESTIKTTERSAQSEAFKTLMENILVFENLDLGLSRHILRRAKRLRARSILPLLLDNFDFFSPVIRDVILYLDRVTSKGMIEHNVDRFRRIISQSQSINYPYVRYWVSYYFSNNILLFSEHEFIKDFLKQSNLRHEALSAKKLNNIMWVREHKNNIDNLGQWDKRSIMDSASILSSGERRAWMNNIIEHGNLMDQSIAKFVNHK